MNKLLFCAFLSFHFFAMQSKPFTIMVNPAGDAKQIGRKIDGYFERGITLQFFQELKKELYKHYSESTLHVISTRFAGDTIEELQNANFANRLGIDLYLSIHFYYEEKTKPDVFLYYFSYGNEFITQKPDLYFWPYDEAYLINFDATKKSIETMQRVLESKKYAYQFTVYGIFKLPFAPLIGIVAPAIGIEIGLKNKDNWRQYVEPIAIALISLINNNP